MGKMIASADVRGFVSRNNLDDSIVCHQKRMKAFVVLAGVDYASCTPIHYAEEVAGRVLFRRWAVYHGQTVEAEVGSCSNGFEKIAEFTRDIENIDLIGKSRIRFYPFSEFIERVSKVIRENPEITTCEDAECPRWRDMLKGGRKC
jgi:aminoglycoside 3-N-acetyltransferase